MSLVFKVNVQTAPRGLADLINLGRFQLRALAFDLGILVTEDAIQAFMAMTVEDQALAIQTRLQELDNNFTGQIEKELGRIETLFKLSSPKGTRKTKFQEEFAQHVTRTYTMLTRLNDTCKSFKQEREILQSKITALQAALTRSKKKKKKSGSTDSKKKKAKKGKK